MVGWPSLIKRERDCREKYTLWSILMVPEAPAPFLYISLNNLIELAFDRDLPTNRTIQPLEPDIIV